MTGTIVMVTNGHLVWLLNKKDLLYTVKTESGMLQRRHIDQLRELATGTADPAVSSEVSSSPCDIGEPSHTSEPESESEADAPTEEPEEPPLDEQPPPEEETETEPVPHF